MAATLNPSEVSAIVAEVFELQTTVCTGIEGYDTAVMLVRKSIPDFHWPKTTWRRDFKSYVDSVAAKKPFVLPRYKHGGQRDNAGRGRKHATAEAARNAKVLDAAVVRRKRRHCEFMAEPCRVSTGYLAYLVEPCVVNIAGPCSEKGVDIGVLLAACKCSFENHHCGADANDHGLIYDYYDPRVGHCGTGQMRRVVNPAPQLARREFGKKLVLGDRPTADALWIQSSFLDTRLKTSVSASLKAIEQVAIAEIKSRFRALSLCIVEGFPRLLELEFLYTPPGAPPQLAHADTRLNVITVLFSLTSTEVQKHVGKSTFYAQNFKEVFDAGDGDDMRNYKYTQFSLPKGVPSITISHGAWPHHGPGNKSRTRKRYTLFMSFAMDDAATFFSTSEKVHRYTVSATPEDEELH
jgi:hypothetical protein